MITPHIFVLSAFLSIIWGWHLVDTVRDVIEVRRINTRRKGDYADAMRNMLCAVSLWSICIAYVLRTSIVLLGAGEATAGQVAFFAIIGVNIPAALSVVASRKYL